MSVRENKTIEYSRRQLARVHQTHILALIFLKTQSWPVCRDLIHTRPSLFYRISPRIAKDRNRNSQYRIPLKKKKKIEIMTVIVMLYGNNIYIICIYYKNKEKAQIKRKMIKIIKSNKINKNVIHAKKISKA